MLWKPELHKIFPYGHKATGCWSHISSCGSHADKSVYPIDCQWIEWCDFVEAAWDLEESWKMPHRVWSYNALGYKVFAASLRCGFWAARLSMVCMNPVLYPGIPESNMCCGRSNRSPRFLGCWFVEVVKVVLWCSTWFWYCNCRSRLLCAVWLRRTRGFDRRPSHRTLRCWKDYVHFCSRLYFQFNICSKLQCLWSLLLLLAR